MIVNLNHIIHLINKYVCFWIAYLRKVICNTFLNSFGYIFNLITTILKKFIRLTSLTTENFPTNLPTALLAAPTPFNTFIPIDEPDAGLHQPLCIL